MTLLSLTSVAVEDTVEALRFSARGVTYASIELAATVAMESPDRPLGQRLDTVFGFHGKHLLADVLAALPESDFAVTRRRLSL